MNKLIATIIIGVTGMTGCTSSGYQYGSNYRNSTATATQIGRTVFSTAINNNCLSELEQQSKWQLVRETMTTKQQKAAQVEVCQCVSDYSAQQVTIADMTNAAIDHVYLDQLVTKNMADAFIDCYTSALK